jgi:hypothetical protein
MRLVIPDAPGEPHDVPRRPRWSSALFLLVLLAAVTALVYLGLRDRSPAETVGMQEKPASVSRRNGDSGSGPMPYHLVVGGFADQSQATRAARRLRVDGWRVEVVTPSQTDSLFTVQVGPLSDRGAAEEAARAVRDATGAAVRIAPVR